MVVYTINLLVTTLFNYISRNMINKKMAFSLLSISVLFASAVAGLRYGVGTDFYEYIQWFNHYLYNPVMLSSKDLGFVLMINVLQVFTNRPQSLFIVSAIIINGFMMNFIKRNTELYDLGFYLFITLYFYYSSLNIMRQWISIGVFLYALKFAFDRKFLKYLLIVVLAASFHITALLMIPLYFVFQLKINIKNISTIISCCFLIANQFERIIIYFANILPFLDGSTSNYISYFDSSFAKAGGGGWAYSVILIVIFFLMYIYKDKYIKDIKNGEKHFVLMTIAAVFALFSPINMIFLRIQLYLMPISLVTLPNIIKIQRSKEKIIYLYVVTALGLLYMYRSLLINGGEPLPYKSFFGYLV